MVESSPKRWQFEIKTNNQLNACAHILWPGPMLQSCIVADGLSLHASKVVAVLKVLDSRTALPSCEGLSETIVIVTD
jgi:hypothetical protein